MDIPKRSRNFTVSVNFCHGHQQRTHDAHDLMLDIVRVNRVGRWSRADSRCLYSKGKPGIQIYLKFELGFEVPKSLTAN